MDQASVTVIISRLTRARQALSLAQSDLSRRSGVPQSQISKLESGRAKDPSLSTILSLSSALNLPIGILASENDNEFTNAVKNIQKLGGLTNIASPLISYRGVTGETHGIIHSSDRSQTIIIEINKTKQNNFIEILNNIPKAIRILSYNTQQNKKRYLCVTFAENQTTKIEYFTEKLKNHKILSKEECHNLLMTSFHFEHSLVTANNEQQINEFIEQAKNRQTTTTHSHFKLENLYTRTLVLYQYAEKFEDNKILDIDNAKITLDFLPADNSSAKRHATLRLQSLQKKYNETKTKELKNKIEKIEKNIEDLENNKIKPVAFKGQILITAQTQEELDNKTREIFLCLENTSVKDAEYKHHHGFLSSLPLAPTAIELPSLPKNIYSNNLQKLSPW